MLLGLLHLFFVVAIIDSRPLSGPITNSSNDILPLMEFRTISHVLKTCNENEVMNDLNRPNFNPQKTLVSFFQTLLCPAVLLFYRQFVAKKEQIAGQGIR